MDDQSPDPGKLWDQALASSLKRLSTSDESAASARLCRTLRPQPAPQAKTLPDIHREPGLIPAAVRTAMRAAVKGELPWPMVLLGGVGTGKTCAALVLLDFAGGHYWTAAELAAERIEYQHGRRCSRWGAALFEPAFWERIERATLVVLDELGARDRVSDFAYETVKMTLDKRHARPLVAISNLTLTQLAALYDARIVSRLSEGTVVELAGPDRRIQGG